MSIGSLPLVALIAIFFFLIPTSILKFAHDLNFPLQKHRLALPRELFAFHFPYFFLALVPAVLIFLWFGAVPAYQLIAVMFFPSLSGSGNSNLSVTLVHDLFSWLNIGFLVLVYALSYISGFVVGLIRWRSLKKDLLGQKALFLVDSSDLIGFWGAIMPRRSILGTLTKGSESPKVTLDILTTQQVLYSGKLFYYSLADGCVESIALKHTQRFLAKSLNDINGEIKDKETREKRYDIPGEVSLFLGPSIANINIREIVEDRESASVISENIQNVTTAELATELKVLLQDVKTELAKGFANPPLQATNSKKPKTKPKKT